MKRILATAGIAGIALIGVTAPANAGDEGDDKKVSICHATGSESNPYVQITVSENAVNGYDGHASHGGDLIPAPAYGCPGGWGNGGGKDDDWEYDDEDCVEEEKPEQPPVEQPPVEQPPVVQPPVVQPPVVQPPVEQPPVEQPPVETPPAVTPPVQPPAGAAEAPIGAAAAVVPVVNRGFNAQTAAGSQPDAGMPAWFGGLAALLGATGLIALRQRGRLQGRPGSK